MQQPRLDLDSKAPLRSSSSGGLSPLSDGRRLTQSWHSGRQEIVYPKWPTSRSFAFSTDVETERETLRAFGGIERCPKPTLPTVEQRNQLNSFSDTYQGIHHEKPHIVAFVNSRSGGQTGQLLMRALSESIGRGESENQAFTGEVCDLSLEHEPASTIKSLAAGLRHHAQRRLLICGGDGTVTWILTALAECELLDGKHHLLPAAIVPLGTGNDLARSLGWGPSLRAVSDVLDYLQWAIEATPVTLDQWRLVLRPHESLADGHKLRKCGSHPQAVSDPETAAQLRASIDEALGVEASRSENQEVFVGFWQNYFSLGMDAKVAWHVDNARNGAVGKACFRWGLGKVCYAWQGLRHSFCTGLIPTQLQRLRMQTLEDEGPEPASARTFSPPLSERLIQGATGRLRQMVMLNINSYAAGLNVLPREEEASARPAPGDGVLEVLGVRNAFASLLNFVRLAKPQYLASARQVVFQHAAGEWMQVDGEPWWLGGGCDVLVEPHRKITMLCAPPSAPFWRGHIEPKYWSAGDRPADV